MEAGARHLAGDRLREQGDQILLEAITEPFPYWLPAAASYTARYSTVPLAGIEPASSA